MKTFLKRLVFLGIVLMNAAISGCSSTPYSIIDKSEGSGTKILRVQVPAGATQSDMQQWASDLDSSERVTGKDFMINFMESDADKTSAMLANYSNGTLTMTTAEERAESAREGD